MLNMWRDTGAGGPSTTAWGNPSRPSQQSAVGQTNQGGGASSGGAVPNQSSLLQVAVPSPLQSVGGPQANMGHQVSNAQQNQIGNQTMVANRSSMLNPQHATSRTSEMSLMLAENLAESVLNHQNNTNSQVSNVAVKQLASGTGPSNAGSGIEKSMQRLSMVCSNAYLLKM